MARNYAKFFIPLQLLHLERMAVDMKASNHFIFAEVDICIQYEGENGCVIKIKIH